MAKEKTTQRPPVVVVLGHVDHGKTTLLDSLRQTRVAVREAGGITQGIGASVVTAKDGSKITFIDTPGHAAFANMRERGAKVADIAVLVVAADDGIKPQTAEALGFIEGTSTPYLVALTKVDLPVADPDKVKNQLLDNGVELESVGGSVPVVEVSAKAGTGLDNLLETISLLAQVTGLSGTPQDALEAYVIESGKGRSGATASLVVKAGTLTKGSQLETLALGGGKLICKVKGAFDDAGKPIDSVVTPGYPVQVLGFEQPPMVGAKVVEQGKGGLTAALATKSEHKEIGEGQIGVVLRASDSGSLEALIASLPENVIVVDSGTGDVTESDILSAKANNAAVYAYKSKIPSSVKKLAETEGVELAAYEIIYKLLEYLEERVVVGKQFIAGEAEIVTSFPYNKQQVAGCRLLKGTFAKGDTLRLVRGSEEVGQVKIMSLRKGKDIVDKVGQGEEFGTIFAPQLEFAAGDMLISVDKK